MQNCTKLGVLENVTYKKTRNIKMATISKQVVKTPSQVSNLTWLSCANAILT